VIKFVASCKILLAPAQGTGVVQWDNPSVVIKNQQILNEARTFADLIIDFIEFPFKGPTAGVQDLSCAPSNKELR
jgi:hypothetical protein